GCAFEDEAIGVGGADLIFVVLVLLLIFIVLVLFLFFVVRLDLRVFVVFVVVLVIFFLILVVFVVILFVFELVVALLFVVGVAKGGEALAGGPGGGVAVDELRIGLEVGGRVIVHQVAKVSGAVGCRHRILVRHGEGSPWAAALPARWMQVAGKRNDQS